MRNLFTDAESSNPPWKNELPETPVLMPFLWTRTSKLKEVWDIVRATRIWPDVAITADSSGLCFSVTGGSLAHLNWEGRLDLPFESRLVDELLAVKTDTSNSERTVFQVQTDADVNSAIRLLRLAYLIVDSKGQGICC